MKGAREYAELFKTGQHGKLYIVSGDHARGRTFRIYVLPKNEQAISNGYNNEPLNNDAIEVYGAISGNPGWTECYGWVHQGPWVDDFERLVEARKEEKRLAKEKELRQDNEREEKEAVRTKELLANY